MKQRCLNPNNPRYKDYGGHGITICPEWMKFENFYKDMGDRPVGKTLDRIDNLKGYYKKNCRWATKIEQTNNMGTNHLITYKGKTQNLKQWSEGLGIEYGTLSTRIWRGWSIKRAFNKRIIKKWLI